MIIKKEGNKQWVFLVNTYDSIEEGMLASILAEAGIPVLKKAKGSGAYMEIFMGISNTGMDLYVPLASLAEASQLIGLEMGLKEKQEKGMEDQEPVDLDRKRRVGKRLITFTYLVPLVLGLFYIVISGLMKLLNVE